LKVLLSFLHFCFEFELIFGLELSISSPFAVHGQAAEQALSEVHKGGEGGEGKAQEGMRSFFIHLVFLCYSIQFFF